MANVLPLTVVLIVIAAGGNAGMAGAQSTPSPSSSCTASLVSMAPCLSFLQGGPNNTTPTPGCCTALASVVSTSAACLCQMVNTTNNPLGIPINQTRAIAMPGACKITTPPLSQCKSSAVSSPPAAPPSSPTPVVSNPTPIAKSPTTSAALPPTTTPTTGGALSPTTGGAVSPSTKEGPALSPTTGGAVSPSTKEGPTASGSAGSMTGVSMLIQVGGIMGSLTYIILASI